MRSPFTHTGVFRILTVLYLGIVALLCFANLGTTPSQGMIWGIPSDKIAHFLLFLPFPFLAWGCARPERETVPYVLVKLSLIFLTGLLLGFGTEFVQGFLPGRCRELADFLADACGITATCLGILILKLGRQ